MELLGGWFRAEGSGSVAVRSERPVRLIFCRAEAEGAAVLSTGEVILDGSRVSPELPGRDHSAHGGSRPPHSGKRAVRRHGHGPGRSGGALEGFPGRQGAVLRL